MINHNERDAIDVDYLFDNFDACCEVEFEEMPCKPKAQSVVKNLSSLFDQAAGIQTEVRGKVARSTGKSKSRENKKHSKDMNEKKRKKREISMNHETIKTKLKLNLQDVFGHESRILKKASLYDTAKSGLMTCISKTNKVQFTRAKTDNATSCNLQFEIGLKMNNSMCKSKASAVTKPQRKMACVKLDGIFTNKDLQTIKRIVGKNASKPNLTPMDQNNPPTGSTRIQLTSSRNGSNKRSSSFFETEDKVKQHRSFRNLRGDSVMISGNVNSILNSSKNFHYKLLKKKDQKKKQPSIVDSNLFIGIPKAQQRTGKSIGKEKEHRKPSEGSKSKYYIPAHIGIKEIKPVKQNSFGHSDDFSVPNRTTYLNTVLFPRMGVVKGGETDNTHKRGIKQKRSKM